MRVSPTISSALFGLTSCHHIDRGRIGHLTAVRGNRAIRKACLAAVRDEKRCVGQQRCSAWDEGRIAALSLSHSFSFIAAGHGSQGKEHCDKEGDGDGGLLDHVRPPLRSKRGQADWRGREGRALASALSPGFLPAHRWRPQCCSRAPAHFREDARSHMRVRGACCRTSEGRKALRVDVRPMGK